jgi:hypothetical protein
MKVAAVISISWLSTCGAELSFTSGAVQETLGFVTYENLTQTDRPDHCLLMELYCPTLAF